MINLDTAAFRAWLEAQPADAIVGNVCDSERCPIASWYASQGLSVAVSIGELLNIDSDILHKTAPWQDTFIDTVDGMPERIGEYTVTAAAALEILGRVERLEVPAIPLKEAHHA